jgi:MHS family alpha-ketoglutarate permease-like MFS transporter
MSQTTATQIPTLRSRIGAMLRATSGNFLEQYDFFLFGFYASAIAKAFFPSTNETASLLNTFGVFWLGALMRPVGAIVLGAYIDKIGRRQGLIVTLAIMAAGTVVIAFCPSYATIGIAAPIIVLLGRLLQGFSAGVELGGVSVYLSEIATPGNRGFYTSFQSSSQQVAIFVAAIIGYILNESMPAETITAWGWRIPFFIGALLAVVALIMRRNLHETEAFEAAKKIVTRTSSIRALLKYPREVMLVVGLTAGGTAAFYTYTTYMQKFLKLSVGLTDNQTTMVTLSSLVFGIILQPIYGAISDRIGRKWLLIGFGVSGVLFTIPILTTLQSAKGPLAAFLLIAAAWMIVSGYTSINAVVKAELFPTKVRAIGVGLPYALTVSIFGGTADSVALSFKSLGHESWFYYYLTGMIGISLVVYLFMRDTKADSAMHRHE